MKLNEFEIKKLDDNQLLDLFWYGDRLEKDEADLIEDEILMRNLDARPDGHLLYKLLVPT